MKTPSFIALLLLAAGLAHAQDPRAGPRGGASLEERFKQLDRNGDGKLTRDEIPRLFEQLDANKDGIVTREEAQAGMAQRRPPATPPPSAPSAPAIELVRTLNIRYATMDGVDAKFHSLDLYAPKDAKKLPVLMMIHGGGWRGGDKGNPPVGENLARFYCGEGFILVSVNYRLTPAGKHPANIQDVAKAVAWVHDHVAEHGGDPERIAVMGHSAGGHLAALVATDEKRLQAEGKSLSLLKRAVLLDSAAYDIPRYLKEWAPPGGGMRRLYESAFGTDASALRDASPQAHLAAGKGIPPMLIFYTGDRMRADKAAPAFADALTKVGSPSRAVDTVTLSHAEILTAASRKGHALAHQALRFLKGEDATQFPATLGASAPAPSAPSPPSSASAKEPGSAGAASIHFTFTQDDFPGAKDARGQFTTGTECNDIVAHDGKLFATLSGWNLDATGLGGNTRCRDTAWIYKGALPSAHARR